MLFEKKQAKPIKTIFGVYEIFGAILGFVTVFLTMDAVDYQNTGLLVVLSVFYLLFLFSFISGYRILTTGGCKLFFINQLLQILSFRIFGLYFTYVSGFRLALGMKVHDDISLQFLASLSAFKFNLAPTGMPIILMVNLIPVFLVITIFYFFPKDCKRV
jgi:hypothetical protein